MKSISRISILALFPRLPSGEFEFYNGLPAKPTSKKRTPPWYVRIPQKTTFGTPIAKKTNMINIHHTNTNNESGVIGLGGVKGLVCDIILLVVRVPVTP